MYFALIAILNILLSFTLLATGIPTWEGLNGRSTVGSLVPGAAYIEALGPGRDNQRQTRHLALQFPGQPGNLTVVPNTKAPPVFYINRNQLWQFNNESSIYYVNILNTTKTTGFPLQLAVGKKQAGLTGGSWRWRGTMLYYDLGPSGNSGLYYSCIQDGLTGIFMYLQPSPTPLGCEAVTLHSWNRENISGHK